LCKVERFAHNSSEVRAISSLCGNPLTFSAPPTLMATSAFLPLETNMSIPFKVLQKDD
ncbi:hypothetical protein J6590_101551, partial [Homalodisca vitripennis]